MDVQQRWAFGCGVLIAGYKYGPSRDPQTYTQQSRREKSSSLNFAMYKVNSLLYFHFYWLAQFDVSSVI